MISSVLTGGRPPERNTAMDWKNILPQLYRSRIDTRFVSHSEQLAVGASKFGGYCTVPLSPIILSGFPVYDSLTAAPLIGTFSSLTTLTFNRPLSILFSGTSNVCTYPTFIICPLSHLKINICDRYAYYVFCIQ